MSMPAGLPQNEVQASLEAWVDNVDLDSPSDSNSDPERTPEEAANVAESEDELELEDPTLEEPGDDDELLAADADGEELEAEADGGEAEADGISTLGAIADYFEVEESEVLENLTVADPYGGQVSIGEALESWRNSEGLLDQRRSQLESEFQTRSEELNSETDKNITQLQALASGLIEIMKSEYNDDVLGRARLEDPDKYTELFERRAQMMNLIENSAHAYEMNAKFREGQSQKDISELLQKENATLLEKKPEWKDSKVRQNDLLAGQRLLMSLGFTQEDLDSVVDHRILILTDLAVKGARLAKDASSKNVEELRKKGLKKPSLGLRTKARKDPENPNTKAKAQARAKLRKTGDVKDAARLAETLI